MQLCCIAARDSASRFSHSVADIRIGALAIDLRTTKSLGLCFPGVSDRLTRDELDRGPIAQRSGFVPFTERAWSWACHLAGVA